MKYVIKLYFYHIKYRLLSFILNIPLPILRFIAKDNMENKRVLNLIYKKQNILKKIYVYFILVYGSYYKFIELCSTKQYVTLGYIDKNNTYKVKCFKTYKLWRLIK